MIRALTLLLCLASAGAHAADRITRELITQLLTDHSTAIMQKDADKLQALFASDYQLADHTQRKPLDRSGLMNIYTGNFNVAKLILSEIRLTGSTIASDGLTARIGTHLHSRYLVEAAGKQKILTQEEDWVSDIGLENGNVVYLNTEK